MPPCTDHTKMDQTKTPKPKSSKLPVVMAVIPVVLFILNILGLILMSLGYRTNDHQEFVFVIAGIFSLIGVFVQPFISLILEIIGLAVAAKRKNKAITVILVIELFLTVIIAIVVGLLFTSIMRS